MLKSLSRPFTPWMLAVALVLGFMVGTADASEYWDSSISDEAVVFVENVWVFSGDCSHGVFEGDSQRFSRSLDELWGLYGDIPQTDRDLQDVKDAVDRLYTIMGNQAYTQGHGMNPSVPSQTLIDSYVGMANRAMLGYKVDGGSSLGCSDTARFLTGLFCVTTVAIMLLCVVYEKPCDDVAD